MARGCALIDSRLDTAKIGSDGRVEVHRARLLAVFWGGDEKRFHTAWVKTGKAPCEHMSSALPLKADIAQCGRHVRFVPILLKKSFLADEQNFSEPLMRSARGDVRDHIVLHKNDHGPSYRAYRALQR